jgi:hypothetical protein
VTIPQSSTSCPPFGVALVVSMPLHCGRLRGRRPSHNLRTGGRAVVPAGLVVSTVRHIPEP